VVLAALASCGVGRSLLYNVSDIRDERKFPSRALQPATQPYRFAQATGQRGVPRSVTLPGKKEEPFDDFLRRTGTLAFVIIQGDSLLYERYFDGRDAASRVPSFSMAKSVTSILIGCAIADGLIASMAQPVTDYVPELKGRGLDGVTIRHVLRQTTGIRFDESYYNPFGGAAAYYYGRGLRKKVARMRPARPPGEVFKYTSGNTQLLGLVLERALEGKSITQYAQEKLWTPLGAQYLATWSLDQKKNGMEKTFCCINATALDFAKLGVLFRDGGRWQGEQLVPESWVRESITPDTLNGDAAYYGHQWWIPGGGTDDFLAQGHLGQYIYVHKPSGLVMVRLGRREGGAPWVSLMRSLAESFARQ